MHTRPLQRRRKRFREQLGRHGFDYKKRCRLTQHAEHCLVNIPEFQPTLFGGLVRWECMHVYYIGFCSWCLEHLVLCTPKDNYAYVAEIVASCNQFRDPTTGVAHPRLRSILRLKHYTAERRVLAIFYWAHVLGLKAEVIVPECRRHAQCAVTALQLILIATRGHRSYTPTELDVIFRETGTQFFRHLEALAQYADNKRVENEQARLDRDSDNDVEAEPWERSTRYVHLSEIHVYKHFVSTTYEMHKHMSTNIVCRFDDESDTVSTDDDCTWGGRGRYEYSDKGIPHAGLHASELVQCGGHHAAYSTALGEMSHKHNIKKAAKFSRTYFSHNESQVGMLNYVLYDTLWSGVHKLNNLRRQPQSRVTAITSGTTVYKMLSPLPYTDDWYDLQIVRGRFPRSWRHTFLSEKVLVTREELANIFLTKMGMRLTLPNLVSVVTSLQWKCFGAALLKCSNGVSRKVVGVSRTGTNRRDFVRLSRTGGGNAAGGVQVDNTALSAQVDNMLSRMYVELCKLQLYVQNMKVRIFAKLTCLRTACLQVCMFVEISGFGDGVGIFLPPTWRYPRTNKSSVVFTLIRWLSPHSNAVVRDDLHRPMCPAPFDINHALWEFTRLPTRRWPFAHGHALRQIHLFPGADDAARRVNATRVERARFDLIQLETIEHLINCTPVDHGSYIMETITLPFRSN